MLRTVIAAAAVIALTALAAVFAALNPGRISIDYAFGAVETERSVAIIGALVVGWLLGLGSAAAALWRHAVERRRLQRALRLAEQEVEALRSIPVQDAD
jgi:uncharacterized integral membrane protein